MSAPVKEQDYIVKINAQQEQIATLTKQNEFLQQGSLSKQIRRVKEKTDTPRSESPTVTNCSIYRINSKIFHGKNDIINDWS